MKIAFLLHKSRARAHIEMLRSALDAEEQARQELRVASRIDMTDEARAQERQTIEQIMGACPGVIPDEAEQETLIDLGYVPVTDPFTQQDGIDPSDIVSVHGLCMSRAALLLYLDRSRDDFGNPPAMPDGLRITQADMQALGLNPMEYGFFNEALPRVHQVAPIEEIDLAALGLDVEEVRAIENAMNEVVAEHEFDAGFFPTLTAAEASYLSELSRDALSLENFIALLERPFTISTRNRRRSRPIKVNAENISLISNLTRSYMNRYDAPVAPAESRSVSHQRLLAKIEYLLSTWRGPRSDLPYNIYLHDNAELRAVIGMHLWSVASALESHAVETLMFPFVDSVNGNLATHLIRALAIARPDENREQIAERVNQFAVVRENSSELLAAIQSLRQRITARGLEISRQIAALNVPAFLRVFSESHGTTNLRKFHFDITAPEFVLQELGFDSLGDNKYEPVKHDLMRYIARNDRKVGIFISLYRYITVDTPRSVDITENNWRMLSLVLSYPKSLIVLLRANAANEQERHPRYQPIAQRMSLETKEFFLASVDDPQSIAQMRFYFGMDNEAPVDGDEGEREAVIDLTDDMPE